MNKITHEQQQKIWDDEHKNPYVLKQMDAQDASSGVMLFWDYLIKGKSSNLEGVEMGCGKGRNVIWLARQNEIAEMYGFDFSQSAIEEAVKRSKNTRVDSKTFFQVQDATKVWSYPSNKFDFAIDCFASTDIETPEGRIFAVNEIYRILKKGGYLLVYTLSTDDEFHKEMMKSSPAEERNAFYHPTTGKFEKTFDEEELSQMYKDFKIVNARRIQKTTKFFGKEYRCKLFWRIYQKN